MSTDVPFMRPVVRSYSRLDVNRCVGGGGTEGGDDNRKISATKIDWRHPVREWKKSCKRFRKKGGFKIRMCDASLLCS